MFPKILLCKIGSYLPIADICRFLCVCKGLDCELFWMFVFQNNIIPNFPIIEGKRKKNYKKKIRDWFKIENFLNKGPYRQFNIGRKYFYIPNFIKIKTENFSLNYLTSNGNDFISIGTDINKIKYLNLNGTECLTNSRSCKINQIKNIIAPNLKFLLLSDCSISVFEDNYFPNLEKLNLSHNLLTKINLSGFPLLNKLDIRNNKIEIIDLSNLKHLDKNYCR